MYAACYLKISEIKIVGTYLYMLYSNVYVCVCVCAYTAAQMFHSLHLCMQRHVLFWDHSQRRKYPP